VPVLTDLKEPVEGVKAFTEPHARADFAGYAGALRDSRLSRVTRKIRIKCRSRPHSERELAGAPGPLNFTLGFWALCRIYILVKLKAAAQVVTGMTIADDCLVAINGVS